MGFALHPPWFFFPERYNRSMKIFTFVLSLALGASCAHKTFAPKNEAPKAAVAVEKALEAVPAPEPEVSIDEDFRNSIRPLLNMCLREDFSDTRIVDVLVISNRNKKTANFGCTDDHFGVELQPNPEFGFCRINVPKNHIVGDISLAKTNRDSSHDYFKILGWKSLTNEALVDRIKKSRRMPLVFVHGFNVKYQEAVLRAAQIAYDLKYQGPVVVFSWPAGSRDGFFDDKLLNRVYVQNKKAAEESIVPFKNFLQLLIDKGIKFNLAVHSMGHQVVLPVLKEFGEKADKSHINELILNAPDFEAEAFTDLTDVIKNLADRITLYCSYNDKAMIASKSMNKNERLGACTFSENVDSINVSLVDGEGAFALGHGYYSSRAVLNDVFQVLLGLDAEKRLFIKRSEPNSTEKYFLRP